MCLSFAKIDKLIVSVYDLPIVRETVEYCKGDYLVMTALYFQTKQLWF